MIIINIIDVILIIHLFVKVSKMNKNTIYNKLIIYIYIYMF